MKSLIRLILPLVFLMAVLAIAEENPPMPPAQEMGELQLPPMPPMGEPNDMQGTPGGEHRERMGMMGQRIRHNVQERETELMTWLEQNDPNKAKELKALKEKDAKAYARRMMFEMRNYWGIIDAQKTNPALAEVLKKDMVLKQQRSELLEKYKAATDETVKAELKEQLKDVLDQRFDLIVQKKQLRYEDLKKRLEQLQDDLKKSQAELDTIKDKKEQQVQKHLDELLNRPEEIDWN
ncbi:MAG: hypothetical protein LLF92_11785 [Planctomycetaceae bacterium]|nr:hypothetical protein [Planctomycetaceae bacterium]